jgi:acyl-CoA synthetase (AMP-forming)/AMP-acid ligase II
VVEGPVREATPGAHEAAYLEDLRTRQLRAWPSGLPRQLTYPLGERPLTDYLRERARREPQRCLLIFYGRQFSYAEIDQLSDRFAAFLIRAGVRPGDRVGVLLPNCPQFLIAFFGILKAAAVHVPVNPMFREEELVYELTDSGARVLLAWDSLVPMIENVRRRVPLDVVISTSLAEYLPAEPALPVPSMATAPGRQADRTWASVMQTEPPGSWPAQDLDTLAALNYTGGTTGLPKGCEHTQRNMIYTAACATSLRPASAGTEPGTGLVFIPVFWIAGEDGGLIIPVFAGSTCLLLMRWDPAAVLAAIDTYRVTSMAATVDNYLELMDHEDFPRYDLSSLRAAGAMSFVTKLRPDIRRRWREAAGGGSVLREGAYGMTETHTIDTFVTGMDSGDHDLNSRPVFCGLPMPGTELKIVSFDSGALMPVGDEGEICIRTPSLFRGYWRKPEETAAAVRDGWLHTGDIGMIDTDGGLHFLGRRKEMLKVNGMSVFPSEIEALLAGHPAVQGSGVIGVTDARRGQLPVAFIQLRKHAREHVSEETLAAWCREHMAGYKVPLIRFVDELPLTATGKVKKYQLAERLSRKRAPRP